MKLLLPVCTLLVSLIAGPAGGQMAAVPGQTACGNPGTATAEFGAVRGEVLYPDRAPVAGAQLTLTSASGSALKASAESDGSFLFEQVPAGKFTLNVRASDVEPATATGTVPAGGVADLSSMMLRLSTVHIEVSAISQQQAAEREVHAEESQRILRAIPNFLVVYDAEPIPLSAGQKFRLSTRTLVDPVNIGVSAAIAGGEQASGSYPGFGNGAAGYLRRFGASVGDGASGMMLTGAILPTLFHQDPRYYFRGSGSRGSRLLYVLRQTVEQKGDNGRWQFAWSNTLGQAGSALISDTYYPSQGHHWGSETGELFGLSVAGTGVSNLLQEFVFGHVTTRRAQ